MKSPKFTTNALASELIREAENAAMQDFVGEPATRDTLDAFAARIHELVLVQVTLGRWAKLGVHHVDEMLPLRVTVETSIVPPPIRVQYDFTKTLLASLIVEHQVVRCGR